MLFRVPRGTSMLGFPDTVTVPSFGVLELTMTAFGSRQIPAVFLKKPDDLLYFHTRNNKGFSTREEDA
jgi:hypothetical protein